MYDGVHLLHLLNENPLLKKKVCTFDRLSASQSKPGRIIFRNHWFVKPTVVIFSWVLIIVTNIPKVAEQSVNVTGEGRPEEVCIMSGMKKKVMANVWNIILSTVIQVIWYNYLVLATRFATEMQYTRCKLIHLFFRWLVRKKWYGQPLVSTEIPCQN